MNFFARLDRFFIGNIIFYILYEHPLILDLKGIFQQNELTALRSRNDQMLLRIKPCQWLGKGSRHRQWLIVRKTYHAGF